MVHNPPIILSQYFLTKLEEDMTMDGKVIPAGTTILFAPQTTAHSVRVPGNKSLFEAWNELSKTDHTHKELESLTTLRALVSQYQSDTLDFLDRVTKLELWATKQGYEYYSNDEVKDLTRFSLYDYVNSANIVRKDGSE